MTLKEYLNTPKVKPSAYLVTIMGIIYFVFTNTTIFENLSENWQTLIYIGIITASTLLGVSIVSLKGFSSELNSIIKDTKLSPDQKVHELTLLAIKVNTQLGLAWESYNLTQEATPETLDNPKEVEDINAKLEALQAEIDKLADGT